MKYKEKHKKIVLPPADVILELLNDEPQKDNHLLDFYNGYIHAAATESLYTIDGLRTGYHINEDLVQEIRIEFLKSLSTLRRKLIECILTQEPEEIPVVIMLPKKFVRKR